MNINKVRQDFLNLTAKVNDRQLIYLDNAATTLKPKCVVDRVAHYYLYENANIHRGVHSLSEQGTIAYENTRETIRSFIKAKHSHEVIFTKGTTDSINLVASSLGRQILKAGDEILLSTMEHHSNIVPWQIIAGQTGAKIVEVPINDAGEICMDTYQSLLGPKTKIVSIVHISNTLGTINPIKEMIQKAHEHGALFHVDAAQSVAHMPVDVQELDCDFLSFSGHKILGPTGTGILYGKEDLLNSMPPYQGGGDMIDVVTLKQTTYNSLPHKFEAGTPNIAGFIALKDAIDYIIELGFESISNQEHELLEYATAKLGSIEGLTIIGNAANKSSVISFVMDGVHPHDIGTLLDKMGIAVRTGHHCTQPLMEHFKITGTVRASFSFYNTKEEIDELTNAINKVKEFI
ncbi:MAG: cysteine desulfurase [Bacteriovoracaceae bacterium]|nr:cysteine desulfurase [Bacteriovoracaceae bacterium]